MKKYRVWADINLDHIAHNMGVIQSHLADETELLVVVKANAYGHGSVPVARTVLEEGATMLGVGDSSEAIDLREAGIRAPILILGAIIEEEIGWVVSYGIRPTLHSLEMTERIGSEARQQDKRLPVHVKVDTGMRRLGARPDTALKIVRRIQEHDALRLEGASTHFSSAYDSEAEDFTRKQQERFEDFLETCEESGLQIPYRHAANSARLFQEEAAQFDMVRPGVSVYGVQPDGMSGQHHDLKPAMSLHSQISFLKGVREGKPVGYDRRFRPDRDTMTAVVPVGYHDGYDYHLTGESDVLIRGQRCPVIGKVTMDYTIVDVGDLDDPEVGERVTLLGENGGDRISALEVARWADTIPYEVLCTLGRRVHRVYL